VFGKVSRQGIDTIYDAYYCDCYLLNQGVNRCEK
jgi:hypothetical protein